ncbi:MAG TPA: polyprenyl synthetase family protein [Phycisphaerales bacterium]|nr:polyprenyl synthetase family protein [Phycisphaerales bacterium]
MSPLVSSQPPATHLPSAPALPLDARLRRVEEVFDRALQSDLPPVQRLVSHLETYRGKMLRPSLVLLSGLAAAESAPPSSPRRSPAPSLPTDAHITIAAVCEMIHMATLVHDDVLDEADIRRQGATVNRLNGNEAAVVLGDYVFSAAYRLCSTLDSQQAALLIGQTGMTLCAGELLQLAHRQNFSIDEPTYFEIVKRKTGSLIAIACRLGAMQSLAPGYHHAPRGASSSPPSPLPTSDLDLLDRFELFGLKLGIAFQIQDDLLDLAGDQGIVGKPLRKDASLGKLTLPVIHHLATAPPQRRGGTLLLLEDFSSWGGAGGSSATAGAGAARTLLEALESTRSIDHAHSAAKRLVSEAKALLADIPDSPAKHTLLHMADQVVTRAS